jgi:predicted Zn-dependent protease
MTRLRRFLPKPLLALALALLAGCAMVPETGRRQLLLISATEEMQLGLVAFERMKQEVPINRDPALNAVVQRVGQRVAAVADLPNAKWEFVVFDSPEANAFCLPGGKVGVYTGILPLTKDEAGLATVIGHEVAHAARRHGNERMSEALVIQMGSRAVTAYVAASEPQRQALATTAYGLGTQLFRTLPHSRRQETEADQVGLIFIARAGFDPAAAVGFWERFADYNRQAGHATPWFLRTHPLDEKRIADLRAWLPRAKAEYRPAP